MPALSSPTPVSVVGVGNILYGDEGVGVFAASYLRQAYRFAPEIEIADGAALGFSIMDFFEDSATVIVLDALLADAAPGTIYRLPTAQLLDLGDDMTPTAHEVDPIHELKRVRAFGSETEMVLLGVVPEDASHLRLGLTPPVTKAFPSLAAAVLTELDALGIRVDPVREVSLDDVIEGLVRQAA